jgi:predicted membrane protein
MNNVRRNSFFGWILLLLGGFFLLDHWYPHLFGWNTILIALGVALLVRAVRFDRGASFPGAFLLLLGLFLLLKGSDVLYVPWWQTWPLILLFLGVSFVVLFAFDTAKRGSLLVGLSLILIAFILLTNPYSWDDITDWIADWWPLLLILVGLNVLWTTRQKRKSG